jgi:hypothetical protein
VSGAPAPPPPVPSDGAGPAPGPTAKSERIEALDVLRGFALLGILLVNIELFRGSDIYTVMLGEAPQRTGADAVVDGLVGWLVTGKFVSSFALLFGVGAAIIVGRVAARGRSPRPLLARRYAVLMLFGDGQWCAGPAEDMLTETALSRLYHTPVRRIESGGETLFVPERV